MSELLFLHTNEPDPFPNKAVFLDRDGTLIYEDGYPTSPYVVTVEGIEEPLRKWQEQGYLLFIISNQSGVGLGYYSEETMWLADKDLRNQLSLSDISITESYYCIHTKADKCCCRKPSSYMLLQAHRKYKLNLWQSIMVGNSLSDIEAGKAADCWTYRVQTNYPGELQKAWEASCLR